MLSKKLLFELAKLNTDAEIRIVNRTLLRHKISQKQLADAACIDTGNLSKILSGVVYPNLKTWNRVQVALAELVDPGVYSELEKRRNDLPF